MSANAVSRFLGLGRLVNALYAKRHHSCLWGLRFASCGAGCGCVTHTRPLLALRALGPVKEGPRGLLTPQVCR